MLSLLGIATSGAFLASDGVKLASSSNPYFVVGNITAELVDKCLPPNV